MGSTCEEKEVYDNKSFKLLKKKSIASLASAAAVHNASAAAMHNARIDRANERSKLWETYKENVKNCLETHFDLIKSFHN